MGAAAGAWRANFTVDTDGDPYDEEYGTAFAPHFVFPLDRTPPGAFAAMAAAADPDLAVAVVDGRLIVTPTDAEWPGGDPVWPPVGRGNALSPR
ncbi:hypothetical protein [Streptomyces sp. NBC_01276]|uniref:hypothetical protein n=1 Tax=Streptomyces sp. NBC_01276 TaxID=2903808 RepID=UPI00352C6DFE